MSKKFQRHVEDFICGQCGTAVTGNGYTNHCPHCLWSRHVDEAPGDRAATCGGLMRPVGVEQTGDGFILTHHCTSCGHTMRCKSASTDDTTEIIRLARKVAQDQS